jgi:hypothetical protein
MALALSQTRLELLRALAALLATILALGLAALAPAQTIGTAFTYQGALREGGAPVNGTRNLTFRLFDATSGGNQIGADIAMTSVVVVDGLFSVSLDFGAGAFNGNARWLEIQVGASVLTPRQELTPTPHALFAAQAGSLAGGVDDDDADPANEIQDLSLAGTVLSLTGDASTVDLGPIVGGLGDGHSLDADDGDPIDALYVDAAGNVGIGTTLPGANLQVGAPGLSSDQVIRVAGNGDAILELIADINNANESDNAYILMSQDGGDQTVIGLVGLAGQDPLGNAYAGTLANALLLGKKTFPQAVQIGSQDAVVMTATIASGQPRVGIGTTAPATALDVNGTVAATAFAGDGSALAGISSLDASDGSPVDAVFVDAAGNVGIGTIAPSQKLTIIGTFSSGDASNSASANQSAAIGGQNNHAIADRSAIVGGDSNTVNAGAVNGFMGGGISNTLDGTTSAILGGFQNAASGGQSVVVGGTANEAAGSRSFAAGNRAGALHNGAFVWADTTSADFDSTAANQFLVRASGGVGINKNNPATALDVNGTVAATAFAGDGSALAGISSLDASDGSPTDVVFVDAVGNVGIGTIAPGHKLAVIGTFSSGDATNSATGSRSAAMAGQNNQVLALRGAIVGGDSNTINAGALNGFVGGGVGNTLDGTTTAILGGFQNVASGNQSVVVGGQGNEAAGNASFAAGRRAGALHDGAFVWADNTNADFDSTAANQFLVRAAGGVGIGKNNPATALDVNGTVTATAFAGNGSALAGINVNDADANPANEIQDLSLAGNTLSLTGDATPVNLSGFLDNTDAQDLSLAGNTLSLSGDASPVDLSGFLDNTDAQDLSLTGTVLSLTGDATPVDLSPILGGLGDGHSLDADDGDPIDALYVDSEGSVGIGTTAPQAALHISPAPQPISLLFRDSDATGLNNSLSVAVQGDFAYVADGSTDILAIFDISNPGAIAPRGSIAPGLETATSVAVQGNFAYVTDALFLGGRGFSIYDVSNPDGIVARGVTTAGLAFPTDVAVQGDFAYVVDSNTDSLRIFDVSNPMSIGSRGSIGGLGAPSSVAVQGGFAYVVDLTTDFLFVFDVSDPFNIVARDSIATGFSEPGWVEVQGGFAYVVDRAGGGLAIFDVSNPLDIVARDSDNTGLSQSRGLAIEGSLAYVADTGTDSLSIFDVSDPLNIVPLVNAQGAGLIAPFGLAVQNGFAYVANQSAGGLAVFETLGLAGPVALRAEGAIRVDGAFFDSGNEPGTAGQVLSSTGAGTAWIDAATAGNDNLGNHAATQALNMGGFAINNASAVIAASFSGDGSTLTNLPSDNLGNHTATQDIALAGHNISSPGDITISNAMGGVFLNASAGQVRVGSTSNSATGAGSGVFAGFDNIASNNRSVVAGGFQNQATNGESAVLGGGGNLASGNSAVVVGGQSNEAAGTRSFAAGRRAGALHNGAFVWADDTAADFDSTAANQFLVRASGGVGINKNNPATALDVNGTVTATAFAGDGSALTNLPGDNLGNHTATTDLALAGHNISSAGNISIRAPSSSVSLSGIGRLVAGGTGGTVSADNATTLGGQGLIASGSRSALMGGNINETTGANSVIVGGTNNVARQDSSGIFAGVDNDTSGGGRNVVLGGFRNDVSGFGAAVVGGERNSASGDNAVVIGGGSGSGGNLASGPNAAVAGGDLNMASARDAVVLGGNNNRASGTQSLAAGLEAHALHDNAFVWSDGTSAPFASTAAGQFLIEAGGGVGIGTNAPGAPLHILHSPPGNEFSVIIENTNSATFSRMLEIKGGQNTTSSNNRFISFVRPSGLEIGAVRQISLNSVDFLTTSDERLKTDFAPASRGLQDLLGIKVLDYAYEGDSGHRQTGFLAQQLREHFPDAVVEGGDDPQTDPWMVGYGRLTPLLVKAIQDQNEEVEALREDKNAEIQRLRAEKDALEAKVAAQEERLARLEALLLGERSENRASR